MAAAAGPSFESSAVFTYSFATVSVHTAVPYHIHIHTLWIVFSTKRSAAQCANKRLEYCRLSVLRHTVPDTALRIARLPYEWRRDAVEQQCSSALFGVHSDWLAKPPMMPNSESVEAVRRTQLGCHRLSTL